MEARLWGVWCILSPNHLPPGKVWQRSNCRRVPQWESTIFLMATWVAYTAMAIVWWVQGLSVIIRTDSRKGGLEDFSTTKLHLFPSNNLSMTIGALQSGPLMT